MPDTEQGLGNEPSEAEEAVKEWSKDFRKLVLGLIGTGITGAVVLLLSTLTLQDTVENLQHKTDNLTQRTEALSIEISKVATREDVATAREKAKDESVQEAQHYTDNRIGDLTLKLSNVEHSSETTAKTVQELKETTNEAEKESRQFRRETRDTLSQIRLSLESRKD